MPMTRPHQHRVTRPQEGIALVIALISVVVVAGIGLLMFTRTINEVRHSGDDARIVQTLMLARGGANVGAAVMVTDVMEDLYEIVFDTATPGRWSYGRDPVSGVASLRPDPVEVARDLVSVATRVQASVDDLVCGQEALGGLDGSQVRVRIYFTETACSGNIELPANVTLPDGRFVNGPARVEGIDVGIQEYALPYVLVSEAQLGDYQRNIVVQGEYIFSVGEAPFSHYAYFTNRESSDGGRIYFTEQTLIDGPTHTNGHFSFYMTPWFGGNVSSAGCQHYNNRDTYRNTCIDSPHTRTPGAYFYSNTLTRAENMNSQNNPVVGSHAPEFTEGVSWNAQYVPLPTNSHSQESVAIGTGRDDRGIHITGDLHTLTMFAGDEAGNEPTLVGGTWTPPATYQYITADTGTTTQTFTEIVRREQYRVCQRYFLFWCSQWTPWSAWDESVVTSCTAVWNDERRVTCNTTTTTITIPGVIRYRFNADNVLEMYDEDAAAWVPQSGRFNGVVYVTGDVHRLRGPDRPSGGNGTQAPPAIASFAQITLASPEDIRITSDLRYEQPPCSNQPHRDSNGVGRHATCDNMSYPNVLGLYTSGGDIIVGNDNNDDSLNAPPDVHVHAVLMSGSNQIRVENYARGEDRGSFNLLGGMIQENRGIFGQFGSGGRRGYDRVYTYDPRMRQGMAPPFFPTTGLGAVHEVRFFSFGQREQLY